jgi:hypothetical protein
VDYLYAFANHAAPTRVWREEQSLRATDNRQLCGDMPHNWASAEFIRLVRHLLVMERGETLELLPGLPAAWLYPGATLRLERTPTRFGPISLDLTVLNLTVLNLTVPNLTGAAGDLRARHFSLRIAADPQWARQPHAVYLSLPAGTTLDGPAQPLGEQPGAHSLARYLLPWQELQRELTLTGQFPV